MNTETKSSLFHIDITCRIIISGCPESGLPALDFRRANGLPERMDNRNDVTLKGDITEPEFRRLIAAGWRAWAQTDGSAIIHESDFRLTNYFRPDQSYGHCATISVSKDDTAIDLLCRAHESCAREKRHYDAGVPDLRDRANQLLRELDEVRAAASRALLRHR